MVYKSYEELTILKISEDTNSVSFDVLEKVIMARPANMIYCETDGKLSGIISMGDIARADHMGKREVTVNRKFTSVRKNEYMKARMIFKEKVNINALPIIDKTNVLKGGYVRWDECLLRSMYLLDYLRNRQAWITPPVLVETDNKKNKKLFTEWRDYFEACGIKVICVDRFGLANYLHSEWIFFVNEDELRGMQTVLYSIKHKAMNVGGFTTYEGFMSISGLCNFDAYLRTLQSEGIWILNLFEDNQTSFIKAMNKNANITLSYNSVTHKPNREMYESFFGELNTGDYAASILSISYECENKSRTGKLRDYKSTYYNVENGERRTIGQPEQFERSIYFLGPCFVYGYLVEDKYTIESFLQEYFNASGYTVKVINCGSSCYNTKFELEVARILTTKFKRGDIVVIYAKNRKIADIDSINLREILSDKKIEPGWITDSILHCNHRVNAIYAEGIYDVIVSKLGCMDIDVNIEKSVPSVTQETCSVIDDPVNEKTVSWKKDFVKMLYLDIYFKNSELAQYGTIGSIVMNCNPFTYGHRYLIEQALLHVDFLIVFVVEEDKSIFSFDERFACVREGVSDLKNVKVVPSGPFILSQMSFPEYFIKENSKHIKENAENDILFFAERIAPYLNIKYRFVGEEPKDVVTNEYNLAMKHILPKHGIKLIEIPRKKFNGDVISASRVRRCLEDGDIEGLSYLVPESTIKVLGLDMLIE